MLRHLEGVPDEVPSRCNCAVSETEVLIAHYIEAEIREVLGETRGCLGWPNLRLKKVKGHLRGLRTALETHRQKWCNEMNEIDTRRRLVDEATVKRLIQNEERSRAFEASWAVARERCLRDLDVGTFTGPIKPIGLRPPEERGAKSARGEPSTEEKRTFLRALEEPPEHEPPAERLGRYSEGGSSGSSGPVRQLEEEVVPPLPPPPSVPPPLPAEADPVEVAPSKGEEVMQRIAEAPARLETKAYEVLEDEFIAVAKPEDLRQEDRDMYEAVRGTGLGLCGRCRWRSGCQSCDEVKAWAFACRSTLWHTAHEAVRPKAKPKGRPKRAAAKA